MNKKRVIVGTILATIMSPVMLAGIAFQFVKDYFDAGRGIAGVASEWLDEKLGE